MAGMMQQLTPFTALALGFAANMVLANDIYVDALGDAATPDGVLRGSLYSAEGRRDRGECSFG